MRLSTWIWRGVFGLCLIGFITLLFFPNYILHLRLVANATSPLQNLNGEVLLPVTGLVAFDWMHLVLGVELVLAVIGVLARRRLLATVGSITAVAAVGMSFIRMPDPVHLAEALGKNIPSELEPTLSTSAGWGLWATLGVSILMVIAAYLSSTKTVQEKEEEEAGRVVRVVQYQKVKKDPRSRSADTPQTHARQHFVAKAKVKKKAAHEPSDASASEPTSSE